MRAIPAGLHSYLNFKKAKLNISVMFWQRVYSAIGTPNTHLVERAREDNISPQDKNQRKCLETSNFSTKITWPGNAKNLTTS